MKVEAFQSFLADHLSKKEKHVLNTGKFHSEKHTYEFLIHLQQERRNATKYLS